MKYLILITIILSGWSIQSTYAERMTITNCVHGDSLDAETCAKFNQETPPERRGNDLDVQPTIDINKLQTTTSGEYLQYGNGGK